MLKSSRMLKAATPYRWMKAWPRFPSAGRRALGLLIGLFPTPLSRAGLRHARPVRPGDWEGIPESAPRRLLLHARSPGSHPRSIARITAAVRHAAPVLRSTAPTCFSTAFGVITTRAATSRSDGPSASGCSTWSLRGKR